MKTLQHLLKGFTLKQVMGSTDCVIEKLCADSREAAPRTCFVAIPGSQVDGHAYIPQAIALGCRAIVCQALPRDMDETVTYVIVDAAAHALGHMAAQFYEQPSKKLQVIAVTGTNGKTTLVHLLYQMAQQMGYKAGMLSTICNKIVDQTHPSTHTTPDSLHLQQLLQLMVAAGCQYCFMEASSHAMVQERLAGTALAGAVFTNITHEHLDYHGTFSNYIQAKKKLFDALPSSAFALVNRQDKHHAMMLQNCKAQKYTFSLQDPADFRGKIVSNTLQGLELEIGNQRVWMQLLGAFNASNLLAAAAAAQLMGLDQTESLMALSAIPPILGRMNRVLHTQAHQVIIDYAHTPDAIQKVLTTLRGMLPPSARILTVMGCGGTRDKQKRPLMGKILSVYSDIALFTSDNPRDETAQSIIQDMQQGVPPSAASKVRHIVDRAMAIQTACTLATPQDVVLVAGKGHQYYEESQGSKQYFCEPELIQSFFLHKKPSGRCNQQEALKA